MPERRRGIPGISSSSSVSSPSPIAAIAAGVSFGRGLVCANAGSSVSTGLPIAIGRDDSRDIGAVVTSAGLSSSSCLRAYAALAASAAARGPSARATAAACSTMWKNDASSAMPPSRFH